MVVCTVQCKDLNLDDVRDHETVEGSVFNSVGANTFKSILVKSLITFFVSIYSTDINKQLIK